LNYTDEQLIDAVVEQLRGSRLPDLFPGITIKEYHGEFLDEELYQEDMKKLPACLVFVRDDEYTELDAGFNSFDVETFICVIMGHRHAAGLTATARGRDGGAGIFDMAREVRRCLAGNDLNLDINPLVPKRRSALVSTKEGTIHYFDFRFVHDYDRTTEA